MVLKRISGAEPAQGSDRISAPQVLPDASIKTDHISLYDGAMSACEHSHAEYKSLARAFAKDDQNDIVIWFAHMLSPFMTVYGVRPPSMTPEIYSVRSRRNDCDFFIEDGNIQGMSRLTKRVEWERLSVQSNELDALLPKLANFDPAAIFKR